MRQTDVVPLLSYFVLYSDSVDAHCWCELAIGWLFQSSFSSRDIFKTSVCMGNNNNHFQCSNGGTSTASSNVLNGMSTGCCFFFYI